MCSVLGNQHIINGGLDRIQFLDSLDFIVDALQESLLVPLWLPTKLICIDGNKLSAEFCQ